MQAEPHENSKGPADDFGSFTGFHALERLSAELVGRTRSERERGREIA